MAIRKICILGLGYIGLPTAATLTNRGMQVIGVDIDTQVVDSINRGIAHIVEPGLQDLVHKAVKNNFLHATTKIEPADIFIIGVPTPFKENHQPDLSYVEKAVAMIASVLQKNNLIVLESTSPVGTTEKIRDNLAAMRPDLKFPYANDEIADINISYCPERIIPGQALRELVENDRVIGGISKACTTKAISLYQLFVTGKCLAADARTAELTKLTENAFRDVNIAFANELSLLCDKFNINVWELIKLANHHPRVNILQPGPGVGGHCIAVDPWFLIAAHPEITPLMQAARNVNDHKPSYIINQIKQATKLHSEPTIACLGLSFKRDVDDLRESPAVNIVAALAAEKIGKIFVVEPHIHTLPEKLKIYSNIQLLSLNEALQKAEIVTLLVDHQHFMNIDKTLLKDKTIIDTRGIWR